MRGWIEWWGWDIAQGLLLAVAFGNLGLTRNLDCGPLKSRETYSTLFTQVRLLALQDFLST
jgi:hypothetical protein